jgi:hypothetical protein
MLLAVAAAAAAIAAAGTSDDAGGVAKAEEGAHRPAPRVGALIIGCGA